MVSSHPCADYLAQTRLFNDNCHIGLKNYGSFYTFISVTVQNVSDIFLVFQFWRTVDAKAPNFL